MPLTNGCFFSYRRRPGNDIYNKFVEGLFKTLYDELDSLGVSIFRDKPNLEEGQFLAESIGPQLCKSACLVVVYTPDYFNRKKPWCAREFMGMQRLEGARLPLLAEPQQKTYGLIIIVVFRGEETLFESVKNRLYFNFSEYTLSETSIPENPLYAPKIKEMAGYIFNRLRNLSELPSDPSANCDGHSLPAEAEAIAWLDSMMNGITRTEIKQQQTPDGMVNTLPFR